MPSSHRFESKAIKNKRKREEVFHKAKKEKGQARLQRRLANAKREADDPKAKQVYIRCESPLTRL
jgi:ribosome production factor 1